MSVLKPFRAVDAPGIRFSPNQCWSVFTVKMPVAVPAFKGHCSSTLVTFCLRRTTQAMQFLIFSPMPGLKNDNASVLVHYGVNLVFDPFPSFASCLFEVFRHRYNPKFSSEIARIPRKSRN